MITFILIALVNYAAEYHPFIIVEIHRIQPKKKIGEMRATR